MALREATHREDKAGLQLVVDEVVTATGTPLSVVQTAAVAANAGVAAVSNTYTATVGSLPTAGGSTTFANTATPTVVELLDAVVELKAVCDALITENATFKTSINAHRTALLAAKVYV